MRAYLLTVNLFGPTQCDGALKNFRAGSNWKFPGSALTASTKAFYFELGYSPVVSARWTIVYTPGHPSVFFRLAHMDDGPSNMTEIGVLGGSDRTKPTRLILDITDAMNALVNARIHKHIGFQVKDDDHADWVLFESRLEINFDLI